MALFQKSVLNKFIKSQDTVKIEAAYQRFSDNFQKAERQAEIRSMKEEEYQDGFLDDLFVNILGYVKRPNAGFNLVREKKNEADSKKADGAILKNDMPLAVIELKGTDTTDLDKVTNQGFGYKNNHKECVYVVISNFEKLRFFIHHAVDYIEFNLFTLSKEDFTTLWLCLHSDNLLDNIPAKIKAESVVKEEDITKNLYKDYSTFKQELWQSIVNLNPEGDPLMFYKKTQKLIDRFLFIFFAEDAGLLPPNSISRMVERWQMLKDEDAYKPLYDIFKQYFGYINTGRPGKTPQDEIFAYNGGLMLEDDVLESITISDDVLLKHVSRLTTYDFSSEVDVNILGHIFENSLNDIEAVTAELEGQEIDKSKTKRKKDGVFYTPKYITKYIVDNTVGKLCDEKKVELNIIDEEYAKGRTNRKKETLKQLDENLQAYRNWLLNITICDPACGSGAFLNQALEYLMEEHRYIDELESQLLGAGFTFPGVENHILENNIFGVDINDESIEIAKLSLWLRTAQRGRKLTSLNNNIKCGNSLIDNPEVAGEKAFNWQQEFPTVFDKGGFDVIIGNPPYVKEHINKNAFNGLGGTIYYQGKMDLWTYFGCIGIDLLKENCLISFIAPNNWIGNSGASIFRNKMLNDGFIENYIDFKDFKVFDDASIQTMIYVFRKSKPKSIYYFDLINITSKNINEYQVQNIVEGSLFSDVMERFQVAFEPLKFINTTISFTNSKIGQLISKIETESNYKINPKDIGNGIDVLQDYLSKNHLDKLNSSVDLQVGSGVLVLTSKEKDSLNLTDEENNWFKPYYDSTLIGRYYSNNKKQDKWILYANSKFRENINLYPNIKKHLDFFSPILTSAFAPYGLHRAREERFFKAPSIFGLRKTMFPSFTSCDFDCYVTRAFLVIKPLDINHKVLTAILNSKLSYFWFYNRGKLQGSQLQIDKEPLTQIPLFRPNMDEANKIEDLVTKITEIKTIYEQVVTQLINLLSAKYNINSISKQLQNWSTLDFSKFLVELKKVKIQLSLSEESEWMLYFNEQKKNAIDLNLQVDKIDKEIDRMVYELYGLTQEEIQIVENS